jgi:hypothetical protein
MVLFSTKATSLLSCAETGEAMKQTLLGLRLVAENKKMGFAFSGLPLGAQQSSRQAVLSVIGLGDFVANAIFSACSAM